ncbi:MAG: VWA domain-containing protein [Acidobacteriia bacterium]|nr:VWA domain-containing protein [Terriglobia bacterium]
MRISFTSSFVLACMIPVFAATSSDPGPRLLEARIPGPTLPKLPADIRVDVNMTLVPVTVMDSFGRNVVGLQPDNFRILDGSRQVPIASFGRQDAPVSVGVVYDCSRSMTEKFKTARTAPSELYKRLNSRDESFLITVSNRADLRRKFTSEFGQIESALLFTHPEGVTPLLDGVYLGLSQLKHAHNPRKALIVVSDGGDNNSRYTIREVMSAALESDTEIFVIGLYDDPQTQEEVDGPQLLATLAEKTGGVNFIIRDGNDLRGAMAKIGSTLHNQYVLGYYPPQDATPGKYRKIKVQVMAPPGTPPLQIYARSGYYAPGR